MTIDSKNFVVTGGSGFLGSHLLSLLVEKGHNVLSIDCLPDPNPQRQYEFKQVDICDLDLLKKTLAEFKQKSGSLDGIFHVAAVLAHDKSNLHRLWAVNVDGTRNIMQVASELKTPKVVFTSSNCAFAADFKKPVDESTPTSPIEEYGRSKVVGEEVIAQFPDVAAAMVRCPTIIAAGRLGLLTILFDFVRENRKLYLVGDGSNRYSFIYANDLCNACLIAMESNGQGIYHIGSDNVQSLRQVYADLCHNAGHEPRFVCLPEALTMFALRVLYHLNMSPLGPYHYRMLSANFVFDTTRIKRDLGWKPTKTNSEMLCEAYDYYIEHLNDSNDEGSTSAHRKPAAAGILNLLRLIS